MRRLARVETVDGPKVPIPHLPTLARNGEIRFGSGDNRLRRGGESQSTCGNGNDDASREDCSEGDNL